jgi:release factor glutamine methyltransferase
LILREALIGARERLRASGCDEPEIEAEVLLRYALDLDRATLLRLLNEPISAAEAQAYERVLYRRFMGEPSAYIRGTREFRGLDFKVTPAVLIPRPETEMLVEMVIEWAAAARPGPLDMRSSGLKIADIGTGSGAIAVSIAKALPDADLYATDLSAEALEVARTNARRHGVMESDWRALPREIRDHEPRLALAAGDDGLDLVRALLAQAPRYLAMNGAVFLEFGIGQNYAIQAAARQWFPAAAIETRKDFGGIPRLLIVDCARPAAG